MMNRLRSPREHTSRRSLDFFIFAGMNDLDDDNLEGDSDCNEALQHWLRSIPGSDEPVEQADCLPGPSGLQSHSRRLQFLSLMGPASPPLLQPQIQVLCGICYALS